MHYDPKEYFEKYYLEDLKTVFHDMRGVCLCDWAMETIFKGDDYKKCVSFEDLLLCLYELNLLGQVVYAHFNFNFDKWKSLMPPYIDGRCARSTHPLSILMYAERESKEYDHAIVFSKQHILAWDQFFKAYVEKICAENEFVFMRPQNLYSAILADPDCNQKYIKDYFSKKT